MYKNVLFDLDGTLTNPSEGISKDSFCPLVRNSVLINSIRVPFFSKIIFGCLGLPVLLLKIGGFFAAF